MGAVPAGSHARLHVVFLSLLPRLERHGRVYFRHRRADRREDMIAEMVGLCWSWFLRLVERGKDPTAFASALAAYAAGPVLVASAGLAGSALALAALSDAARSWAAALLGVGGRLRT